MTYNESDDKDVPYGEWSRYKADKVKRRFRSIEEEKALLHGLPGCSFTAYRDEHGVEKYIIVVDTQRGLRTVEWWPGTSLWKVKRGKGQGYGLYGLARYFQLIPKDGGVKK